MGDLRKEWTSAKKKFEALDFKGANGKDIIDPKKAFGSLDFGPLLDAAETAMEDLEKNNSMKNAFAADEALKKAVLVLDSYNKKATALEADLKTKKETLKKFKDAVGSAFITIGATLTDYSKDVATAKKEAAQNDPGKAKKILDAAVKKVATGLGVVGSKPDPAIWAENVQPAMFELGRAIMVSKKLAKHGADLKKLEKISADAAKPDVLAQLKNAVVAIKVLQHEIEVEYKA